MSESPPGAKNAVIAGVLAWAFPGAGHWYLGWRAHGVLFGVVIVGLFWGGMLIGGVKSTVDPAANKPWFVAQACSGVNPLVALGVDKVFKSRSRSSFARANELGIVYSGIAGLLNLLVVLDAAARAELPRPESESTARRSSSPRSRGG